MGYEYRECISCKTLQPFFGFNGSYICMNCRMNRSVKGEKLFPSPEYAEFVNKKKR